MNKLSLFELTKEQIELIAMIEENVSLEGEIDEFTEAALQINKQEFVEKATDYVAVIKDREYNILRAKEAKKQIDAYIADNDRVLTKLKNKLEDAVSLFGPIVAGFTKLSLRKSSETIITDMAKIPEKYLEKKIVITANKTAIKKDFESGIEVPGAFVNQKNNIQIK